MTQANLPALPFPPNGVIADLGRADYDALPFVHWSTLKLLVDKAPAHYRHAEDDDGHRDSDAMRVGRAFHCAVLEPHLFASTWAVWPTSKGSRRTKAFGEWQADQLLKGLEVLDSDEEEQVNRMRDSVRAHADTRDYLEGQAELTALWQHTTPAAGDLGVDVIQCRARIDLLSKNGPCVELKSTKNGGEGFGGEAARYLYHAQAAFYVEGLAWAEGFGVKQLEREHLIIATENFAPFVTSVYRTPAPALQLGRAKAHAALERLAYCNRTGEWGGYFTGIRDLELPRWAFPPDEVIAMEVIDHES